MDQEMERYRMRLQRKWDRRVTRRGDGERRVSDYKPPRFWTWGFVIQFFTLIVGGFILLFLAGCAAIKRSILGG